MADDLIPTDEPSGFLDKLNLPKLLGGHAGDAISRLVAGAVDIPGAWLNQFAQGIRDKTAAKTAVSKAVGDAAANLAANDPEVVKRATYSLLSKQIQRQQNRESVAKKTVEILGEETAENKETTGHKVDDDWLNVFERYAEDASSERLQEVWARILSGQIRRPKAFSLQTLRFVSELDETTAALFEKYAPRVLRADFIPNPPKSGLEFTELLQLEDSGLIAGTGGALHKMFDVEGPQFLSFPYKTHHLLIATHKKFVQNVPAILLTRVGREVYSIIKSTDDIAYARDFAEKLQKDALIYIVYAPLTLSMSSEAAVVLWQKPPDPAPAPPAK